MNQFILSVVKIYQNTRKTQIPGTWQFTFAPRRIPFIAPYLYLNTRADLKKAIEKYGDSETKILRVSLIDRNVVIVYDKDLLKEMYTKQQHNLVKPSSMDMFDIFGPNILSAPSTEEWKKHHKACFQAFSLENLKLLCGEAVNSTDLLMKRWDQQIQSSKDGSTMINPAKDYTSITLDVIGKVGFGMDFGVFSNSSEGNTFKTAVEQVIGKGVIIRRFLNGVPILYPLVMKCTGMDNYIATIDNVLERCIEERKKEFELNQDQDDFGKKDILSLLIKANLEDKMLTNQELKSGKYLNK